ncbi:MAG: hypothetical protein ABI594_08845 [Ginsengibacter sp.]
MRVFVNKKVSDFKNRYEAEDATQETNEVLATHYVAVKNDAGILKKLRSI